jgi:hypothetical protein
MQDMEHEMQKRDTALDKRENEVFELIENKQKLSSQVDSLKVSLVFLLFIFVKIVTLLE